MYKSFQFERLASSDDWDVATSPVDASKCWCRSVSDTPSDIKIDHKYLAPKYDVSNANYRSLQVICCGIRELL